jgi:uncharacterized Tic20 family protein
LEEDTRGTDASVRLASAQQRRLPRELPPLLPEERVVAALCHLSTLVPLWAVPANALLYFLFRQSSRTICFHARQGIHYHFLFLLVAVPFLLMIPLENLLILAGVPQNVAHNLPTVAFALLGILYLVYAAFCLVGAIQALQGKSYAYPLSTPLLRVKQAPVYIRVPAGPSPSPQPESESSASDAEVSPKETIDDAPEQKVARVVELNPTSIPTEDPGEDNRDEPRAGWIK